jgi:hypothetical protein
MQLVARALNLVRGVVAAETNAGLLQELEDREEVYLCNYATFHFGTQITNKIRQVAKIQLEILGDIQFKHLEVSLKELERMSSNFLDLNEVCIFALAF